MKIVENNALQVKSFNLFSYPSRGEGHQRASVPQCYREDRSGQDSHSQGLEASGQPVEKNRLPGRDAKEAPPIRNRRASARNDFGGIVNEKILEALRADGDSTARQLARKLDVPYHSIYPFLEQLMVDGKIIRIKKHYRLKT